MARMHGLAGAVAALPVFYAIAVFFSYPAGLEFIHRPIPNGPATNPLTALCIMFTGVAILIAWIGKSPVGVFATSGLVFVVSVSRMIEIQDGAHILNQVLPDAFFPPDDEISGNPNQMGFFTAVMFTGLAAGSVLSLNGRLRMLGLIVFGLVGTAALVFTLNQVGLLTLENRFTSLTTALNAGVLAFSGLLMCLRGQKLSHPSERASEQPQ